MDVLALFQRSPCQVLPGRASFAKGAGSGVPPLAANSGSALTSPENSVMDGSLIVPPRNNVPVLLGLNEKFKKRLTEADLSRRHFKTILQLSIPNKQHGGREMARGQSSFTTHNVFPWKRHFCEAQSKTLSCYVFFALLPRKALNKKIFLE